MLKESSKCTLKANKELLKKKSHFDCDTLSASLEESKCCFFLLLSTNKMIPYTDDHIWNGVGINYVSKQTLCGTKVAFMQCYEWNMNHVIDSKLTNSSIYTNTNNLYLKQTLSAEVKLNGLFKEK